MLLMLSDHANEAFNADRPVTDMALLYNPPVPLDPLQYGVRWLSHLCAPTFLFLAGVSLALSVRRRVDQGVSLGADLFRRVEVQLITRQAKLRI